MSSFDERTVRCPHCGKLYKLVPMVSDQSACPSCVLEAERNMRGPWRPAPYSTTKAPEPDHD